MVVRMRSTRSHTGNRRSHHGLKAPEMAVCSNCGGYHRPHHMCLECGFYNGRMVVDIKAQKAARDARIQAKKSAIKAQAAQAASEDAAQTGVVPAEETAPPAEDKK